MALFEGEPLVEIEVGGRVMKVPASVAGQLAIPTPSVGTPEFGLGGVVGQPNPPKPPPPPPQKVGTGAVPIIAPIGELPPANQDPVSVTGAPEVVADPNATSPSRGDYAAGVGSAPQLAKDMKARSAANAKAAASAPKPPTATQQLQQDGYGGAYSEQERANKEQRAALLNTADAEALGQDAAAEVLGDRNKAIDKLFADRETQAKTDLDAIQKRIVSYDAATKKYADAKVDRSVDHPIMAAVGVLMAGLGMAMMGKGAEENPAIKALHTAIDRKVAGQMADIEKSGKALGFQKEAIENMRGQAKDQLAFKNLLISGETERAARYMEEIAAKTNSDVIRSRALEGAAGLRARAADLKMAAVDKQTESDHKERDRAEREASNKRSVAAQNYATHTGYKMHKERLAFDKEKLDGDLAKAMMEADKAGDKAKAELFGKAAKENNERGLGTKNGDYALQPEGKKVMEEAEKLEKQAAEVAKKNPQAAQTMMVKAREMRAAVLADERNGVFRMPSGDAKMKFVEKVASVQKVNDLVGDIKRLYNTAGGGKAIKGRSDIQQVISSKYVALLMAEKNIDQLGVLSKTDVGLMTRKLGEDPTKWDASQAMAYVTDKIIGDDYEGFMKVLDGRVADTKKDIGKQLKTAGYRGSVTDFFDDEEKTPANSPATKDFQDIYADKTTEESQAGARRDAYREADQGKLFSSSSPVQNVKDTGAAVRSFVQKGMFGGTDQDVIDANSDGAVSKDASAAIDRLIARAKGNDESAAKARELLLQGANDTDKPAHAGAIRVKLMQQAPQLFKQTKAGQEENKTAPIPMLQAMNVPIESLASRATISQESFDELSKIAASGDAYAQKLLKGVTDYRARRGK